MSKKYFCNGCGHLRLAVRHIPATCKNCGSLDIIVSEPGTLDEYQLKRDWLIKITKEAANDDT